MTWFEKGAFYTHPILFRVCTVYIKVSNGKSFIDYWVKEYSKEMFHSESFGNK